MTKPISNLPLSEFRNQNSESPHSVPSCLRAGAGPDWLGMPSSRGFTLVELLVTMSIFVILLAISVPVFRTLTSSRSVAAATNIVSATLGRVRSEAIGLQAYRGVMFYLDPNTGREGMVTLQQTASPAVPLVPADVWFDLDSSVEPMLLPQGVGLQTVLGASTSGTRTGNGYVGLNKVGTFAVRVGGVIVFAPDGHLNLSVPGMVLGTNPNTTPLGILLFGGQNNTALSNSSWYLPNVGFCLFDTDPYLSEFGGDAAWEDNQNPATYGSASSGNPQDEYHKETWLDANATPFLINRYNGTLIRGE